MDHRELVAAESGAEVALLQAGGEAVRDFAQQLVTRLVPEGVVDVLEPIEIDEQEAQLMAVVAGALPQFVEFLVERMSVGQPGKRIVMGQIGDAILAATRSATSR